MIIGDIISKGIAKIGIKRKPKKRSILADAINNPENFKLEAFIEGEEIILKIKRKEESQ